MKWWRGFVGAFMFLAAAPGCTGSSTGDTGSLTTGGSGAGGASSGGTSVGGSSGGAVNATGAASATGGGVSVAGAAGSTTVEPPAELPLTVAFTGSGANRGVNADNGPLNIGHQFSVSRSVTMVDLGVWDEGADGLARSHVVTLFRLDQQGPDAQAELIVGGSVTVPAGVVAELEDGFRFASLATPLVLEPGDYAVIAYGLGADDAYGDGGSYPVPESGVQNGSFTPWEFVDSASPAYPSGGDTGRTVSVSFRFESGQEPPLRILPLGDSITWGVGGTDAGYRRLLADLLHDGEIAFQFVGTDVGNEGTLPIEQRFHEGHPGWVIEAGSSGRDGLRDHIDTWLGPTGVRPDVVLLMIGTNDVSIDYQLDQAAARLDGLVTRIIELVPEVHVVVAQVVPTLNAETNARAVSYNQGVASVVAGQQALGRAVTLVDMHGALGAEDMADNLHPNDQGFQKMADVWFQELSELLSEDAL